MLGARASTFPLPSRQTLEVDFLENRPSEFRRTAANCIFDTDKRQFAPLIPVGTVQTVSFEQDASEESEIQLRHTHDSFRTAVEALKETAASKNKTVATFQLSNAHSWGEVAKAAKDAEETYLKADSPTSKVRSAFRRIEKNAKSIKPFLGMLPDGEYKTLAGGLTLVLSVMMKKAEMREKMAELLDRLPLIVQNCEDYAQIYPGKNTLRRRIEELYIQIVGAIEDMVRWYTQKASKRALKSVFSNDAYLDSLDKRIRDIDVAHDAFKEVAERYLHWQTALMQHNVAESHALTQETNENLKLVGFKLYEQGQQIKKEVSQMESRLMNGINDILGDHRKNAEWLQEKKECQQKIADQDARIKDLERQLHSKSFRAATLARRLHLTLPFDAYADDVQRAISEGIIRSTKFQTRSKQIAAAEEFRQWFTSDSEENALLCVNGNADQDSLSPTTFLAALLIQNLEQKEAGNVLVLRFFCGLHTNTLQYGQDHEIGGPLLLVRALVAQILNIDSIDDRHYLSSIAEDSVQAMEDALLKQYLATLSELLHRLRRDYHGVMIVIDGIEFYNTTEHRRATKRLIKSFANITSEKSAGGSLKVLLMAASDCSLFRRIGGFSVLDMPEDIECGGSDYESLGEL